MFFILIRLIKDIQDTEWVTISQSYQYANFLIFYINSKRYRKSILGWQFLFLLTRYRTLLTEA